MRFLLILGLAFFVTMEVRSTCMDTCERMCNTAEGMCSENMLTKFAGISCKPLGVQCNTTCNKVYCKCIENITETCFVLKDLCEDAGSKSCLSNVFNCLISQGPNCGLKYATTVTSVATDALSEFLPNIPDIAALFLSGHISHLINLDGLDMADGQT